MPLLLVVGVAAGGVVELIGDLGLIAAASATSGARNNSASAVEASRHASVVALGGTTVDIVAVVSRLALHLVVREATVVRC